MSSPDVRVSNTHFHAWPAVRLGISAEIAALVDEFDQAQWLDAEEIAARQIAQVKRLLEFVGTHSPFYRDHAAAALADIPGIRSIADFHELPRMTRADLQNAGEEFFCRNVPPDQGAVNEILTSGSTGQPVRVRKTAINDLFWQANMIRVHDWHEIPYRSRCSILRFGQKEYSEQANWGPPFSFLYRTGRAQFIPISLTLEEQARLLRQFQPEVLQIMPSNLGGLIDIWRVDGMDLTELEFVRTIGEVLTDELRQSVAELGAEVSVVDGYSSQEVGSIALQCPLGGGYHANSESLIVEVLDESGKPCEPGEVGRVVVTDLHNLASPVVRYEIGDYAQVGEPCPCGRGLLKLDRILGRSRNLLVRPNGDRYWPGLGFRKISEIVSLRQLQLVQESLERITVRLVTDEPVTDDQRAAIIAVVRDRLGYPFDVDIKDQRDLLPVQPGGKIENFISRVST